MRSMRKTIMSLLVAAVAVTAFSPGVANARRTKASPKIPPVCVERNLPRGLHVQVGYCPG